MSTEISLLRAAATGSGAKQWSNCPASVSLALDIIEEEKDYTKEGTLKHKDSYDGLFNNTPSEEIEDEAVRTYVDYIRATCPNVSSSEMFLEQRLSLLGTSGGIDCYIVQGKRADIFDFKYGVGVKLQALGNEQLAFYACAVKERHPEVTQITVHLIQPRVKGVFDEPQITSWVLPWQSLRMWRVRFEDALNEVEKAREVRAGEWCQFCKALAFCPAQINYAKVVEREQGLVPIGKDLTTFEKTLTVDQIPTIARILLAKPRLTKWFKKAEDLLLQQAKAGAIIPGFELKQKGTKRKWKAILPEEEIAEKLIERGCKEPWEKKLIAFTAAEKQCSITDLVEKPEGGLTLKPLKEVDEDEEY